MAGSDGADDAIAAAAVLINSIVSHFLGCWMDIWVAVVAICGSNDTVAVRIVGYGKERRVPVIAIVSGEHAVAVGIIGEGAQRGVVVVDSETEECRGVIVIQM